MSANLGNIQVHCFLWVNHITIYPGRAESWNWLGYHYLNPKWFLDFATTLSNPKILKGMRIKSSTRCYWNNDIFVETLSFSPAIFKQIALIKILLDYCQIYLFFKHATTSSIISDLSYIMFYPFHTICTFYPCHTICTFNSQHYILRRSLQILIRFYWLLSTLCFRKFDCLFSQLTRHLSN